MINQDKIVTVRTHVVNDGTEGKKLARFHVTSNAGTCTVWLVDGDLTCGKHGDNGCLGYHMVKGLLDFERLW